MQVLSLPMNLPAGLPMNLPAGLLVGLILNRLAALILQYGVQGAGVFLAAG